jgi:hypothetical protein
MRDFLSGRIQIRILLADDFIFIAPSPNCGRRAADLAMSKARGLASFDEGDAEMFQTKGEILKKSWIPSTCPKKNVYLNFNRQKIVFL